MTVGNFKVCHDHKSNEKIHHPANKILEVSEKSCQSCKITDIDAFLQIIKNCPKYCDIESGFLKDEKIR